MLLSAIVHIFKFSIFVSQIPRSSAVPNDGQPNSLLPTWELADQPGSRDTGRCTAADLDMLKASYEDACLISRKAQDDTNFIITTSTATNGKDPAKAGGLLTVSTDYEKWHRIIATYISLFGATPLDGQGGVTASFSEVQGFYNGMVNRYCKGDQAQFVFLFCKNKHYVFIKNGETDRGDSQNRNIEITHPQCKEMGGVWYTDQLPEEDKYLERPSARVARLGPVCNDDDTLAATQTDEKAITFCNTGLDPNVHTAVTISNLRPMIKATKTRIKKGDFISRILDRSVTLLSDLKGDGKQIVPVTWIHEMVHLLRDTREQPAVDKKGAVINRQRHEWNEKTSLWELKEEPDLTYGYELCRNLAKWKPELTTQNPDSIAFFGTAMFLDGWDWSRGYAMPKKST